MPDCNKVIISDPIYEEVIKDLISAGNILTKCTHSPDGGVCALCLQTWEGVVDNAGKVTSGKAFLRSKGKK